MTSVSSFVAVILAFIVSACVAQPQSFTLPANYLNSDPTAIPPPHFIGEGFIGQYSGSLVPLRFIGGGYSNSYRGNLLERPQFIAGGGVGYPAYPGNLNNIPRFIGGGGYYGGGFNGGFNQF